MDQLTIKKSAKISSRPEKVYEFLTTPGKVKLALPGLMETNNTPQGRLKEGDSFDTVYRMYGVLLYSKWHVHKLLPTAYYEAYSDGDVKSTWKYDIRESGNETELTVEVSYEIPQTILGKVEKVVLEALNEREIEHYLRNIGTIFELQG